MVSMDLEILKRKSIADICVNRLGYVPNKGHDSKLWRSLKSPNGHVIITKDIPSAKTGHYIFKCDELGVGGTIVDLLIHLHGYSFSSIFDYFGEGVTPFYHPSYDPSPVTKEEYYDKDNTEAVRQIISDYKACNEPTVDNYFTGRSIDQKVVDLFGLSTLCSQGSAIIPLYRLFEGRWAAQTAITYYVLGYGRVATPGQVFTKGLARKDSFSLLKPRGTRITDYRSAIIFESPVDALSYFQMNGTEALYISTCGTLTNAFKSSIPLVFNQIGIRRVTLSLDNDDAGRRMTDQLRESFSDHPFEVTTHVPSSKDWNDDLKQLNS